MDPQHTHIAGAAFRLRNLPDVDIDEVIDELVLPAGLLKGLNIDSVNLFRATVIVLPIIN